MKALFAGELMVCICCGKEQRSDPKAESQWRAIDYNGRLFYVCPDEFPPDTATALEFEAAYIKVFRDIIQVFQEQP